MTRKRMAAMFIFTFLAVVVMLISIIVGPSGTALYIMGCADILALIAALIAFGGKENA